MSNFHVTRKQCSTHVTGKQCPTLVFSEPPPETKEEPAMGFILDSYLVDLLVIVATLFFFLYRYFTSTFDYFKVRGIPYLEPTPFFGNIKDLILMRISGAEQSQNLYRDLKQHRFGGVFHSRRPGLMVRDPELLKLFLQKDFNHFQDRGMMVADIKKNPIAAHLFNLEGSPQFPSRTFLVSVSILQGPRGVTPGRDGVEGVTRRCGVAPGRDVVEGVTSECGRRGVAPGRNGVEGVTSECVCAAGVTWCSPRSSVSPVSVLVFQGWRGVAPGATWRNLRVKLNPTFTPGRMKMMFQLLNECAKELQAVLKQPADDGQIPPLGGVVFQVLEMRDVFAQYTTDVIGTCVFGLQFNSMKDPDSEFRRMGKKVFQSSFKASLRRFLVVGLPGVAKLFNLKFASDDVSNFFLKYTQSVSEPQPPKSSASSDSTRSTPFVCAPTGAGISHEVLCDMTCSSVPHKDTKVLCDTTCSFVPHKDSRSCDKLLKQTKNCDETLRKYPPAPNLYRKCTIPYPIPGTSITLEQGTRVLIPAYAIHHDPEFYPEPEKFDPERFTEENKGSRPSCTYLPFGEGPRICIGEVLCVLSDFRYIRERLQGGVFERRFRPEDDQVSRRGVSSLGTFLHVVVSVADTCAGTGDDDLRDLEG
uniref:Cytochrome P450 n=1 Tax=Timema bartmani TaxID=61472 RepID=A0A7R9HZ77_9NEOP|nr:unnamed protein product [Timema bartmani]